jgi:FkbM family methyltransferase
LNACGTAIVPVPLPLSDVSGLVTFTYRSLEPGQSRHALGETREAVAAPTSYVQPVCATTLDAAVNDFKLPPPQHLKIDVDGSELRVLKGGAAVLRSPQLRTVLIESDAAVRDALAAELTAAGFALRSRHERPGKQDAPMYAVWSR